MNLKSFLAQFRNGIKKDQASGRLGISYEDLLRYVDHVDANVETNGEETPSKLGEVEFARWQEDYKTYKAFDIELFRAAFQAGQNALRAALILNGGASVALLAFIGHLAVNKPELVTAFACPMIYFCFGALTSVVGSGIAYLCQRFFAERNRNWCRQTAIALNILAVIVILFNYWMFAQGCLESYSALSVFEQNK